jgi:hypothetical protein
LGGCTDDHGPEGSCPNCPLHWLDEQMAGPLGRVLEQAFRLLRRKAAGFPMPAAETLPADLVAAVEILTEEQQAYQGERQQQDEREIAVKRELEAKAKRGGS